MSKRKAHTSTESADKKPVKESEPAAGSQPAATAPQEAAKRPIPDPFSIAGDYVAGAQLLESRHYRQMHVLRILHDRMDAVRHLPDN
jgi:hypothetical protein